MLGDNLLPVGNITKAGTPVNGRQTYELTDSARNKKYTYTVPEENADTFEKLYEENNTTADSINSPEAQEKLVELGRKLGNRVKIYTFVGSILGAGIPAALAIFNKGKVWKRAVFGTLGAIAGGTLGALGTTYLTFSNGFKNIVKNSPTHQKLEEISHKASDLGVECQVQNIQA